MMSGLFHSSLFLALSLSMAFGTGPITCVAVALSASNGRVLDGVLVPGRAMGLGGVASGDRISPKQVDLSGCGLHMIRVAARSISAQVIKVEALRDIALGEPVRHAVRQLVLTIGVDATVTVPVRTWEHPAVAFNAWWRWNHGAAGLDFFKAPNNGLLTWFHGTNDMQYGLM